MDNFHTPDAPAQVQNGTAHLNGYATHNGHSATTTPDTTPRESHNGHTNGLDRAQSEPYFDAAAIVSGPLDDAHRAHLEKESAISEAAITARGYFSTDDRNALKLLGFAPSVGRCLIIPTYNYHGTRGVSIARPDIPTPGKKYLLPKGASAVLDIAPLTAADIGDPAKPLIITEGAKKADAAASQGLCAINLNGVYGFRGRNAKSGIVALPDWENIALKGPVKGRVVYIAYDSDVATKLSVGSALTRLCAFLTARGAIVKVIYFPEGVNGEKTGLDDFFARGGTVAELFSLARDLESETESKRKKKEAKNAETLKSLRADGVPLIETNDRQSNDELQDLSEAVAQFNAPTPTLFHGAGGLVHVERDKDGEPFLSPVSLELMQVQAGKAARWISTSEREGIRNISPPRDLCANFLKARSVWRNVPPIDGIKTAPFVDTDGAIISASGYHAGPRVFLDLPAGFALPDTRPTPENIAAAKEVILETLFGEVAFADEASRAHAVGLMLLPFVRRLIEEQTPLHVFNAPVQSSGKTYAAQICVAPFTEAIPSPEKKNDEENRKSIFAQLATGCSHMFLDNIKGRLSDPTLAAAITIKTMKDRLIGTGQMVTVSTRVVWLATANNAQLDRDAVSRCVTIKLDTNEENPEGREFKSDPLRYVAKNRAQVIGALLTLVRNWQAQGSRHKAGKTRSRFKQWENVIGGILESNGIAGFLDNIDQARESLDPDADAWREFVAAWHAAYGTQYITAKELLPIAMKCDELAADIGEKEGQARRFGQKLLSNRDKIFSVVLNDGSETKLKISRSADPDKKEKIAKWRVTQPVIEKTRGNTGNTGNTLYPTRNLENLGVNSEKEEYTKNNGLSHSVYSEPPVPPVPPVPQLADSEAYAAPVQTAVLN